MNDTDTDTTDPVPDDTEPEILTLDQRARVQALHVAREVTMSRPGFVGSHPASAGDLIVIAQYILDDGIDLQIESSELIDEVTS